MSFRRLAKLHRVVSYAALEHGHDVVDAGYSGRDEEGGRRDRLAVEARDPDPHRDIRAQAAVVGVAKTKFAGAPAVSLTRGASKSPLFITAVGMPAITAAKLVARMNGAYRIPTLLKRADQLCRSKV